MVDEQDFIGSLLGTLIGLVYVVYVGFDLGSLLKEGERSNDSVS